MQKSLQAAVCYRVSSGRITRRTNIGGIFTEDSPDEQANLVLCASSMAERLSDCTSLLLSLSSSHKETSGIAA